MILCVELEAMKCAYEVQKDLDLEDLLINHTKYFDDEGDALKEQYVPLDFAVTIRSVYSNKVLQIPLDDGVRYYTNIVKSPQYIHKGYDLVMFLASIGLMHNVDYSKDFDVVMGKYSQFQCIGLLNSAPDFLNPIVYSHILIADEGVEELSKFLKTGCKFVTIEEAKKNCVGNLPALMNTLIEVKESEDNGNNDN